MMATRATLKFRERLQEERKQQAIADKRVSEALAKRLEGKVFETTVKVDPEGNLYGSVTAAEVSDILLHEGYQVTRRHVALHHPIKTLGTHHVNLRLPEGVEVVVGLMVKPDREVVKREVPVAPVVTETEEAPKEE